jgi:glycosyltransferase involved in cell wall biosynthesis
MRIFHVGASPLHETVNGANTTIWQIAREQVRLGHQVFLLLHDPPSQAALTWAQQVGLELVHVPATTWRYAPDKLESVLSEQTPQIIHMHSVFLLKQATLARTLVQKRIPYLITPNAIDSQLLRRGWLKKILYSWLVEKPRFYAAAAIVGVTPKEAEAIRAFVPGYQGIVPSIPNPVNPDDLEGYRWQGNVTRKRLVYLGRFDVLHKGIDILIDIARWLPDVEVHLYGSEDKRTKPWLERLKRDLPPTVYFHDPVFGVEKGKILAEASLYIQTSRWEVFGVSIAEAMGIGIPCAILETLNLAELFQKHDLGLVLPSHPQEAASLLREVLNQSSHLQKWSERGRDFVQNYFLPSQVASEYITLYQKIVFA